MYCFENSQKIKDLEETMAKYKETEAVHKYTEEQNQRVESKYKEEISTLQRRLSSSQEGREYESELWHEKLETIKNFERVGHRECVSTRIFVHTHTQTHAQTH